MMDDNEDIILAQAQQSKEPQSEYFVTLKALADQFGLTVLTPHLSLDDRKISTAQINRPALQLAGYYEYFDRDRVQLIGKVEYSYVETFEKEKRIAIVRRLLATHIACLVICRGLWDDMDPEVFQLAEEYDVPILGTREITSSFTSKILRYLSEELAPRTIEHGVMVDCFGEGVLILGDSGMGKSETALELVQRGHRLIADDVVEIRKYSESELNARSVDIIQNLIELRGIGVINVKELYGVQSVTLNKTIDMVIKLETWNPSKQYDRMGLERETMNILGIDVVLYSIPIMVGRDVAMLIETAALNHRQKKMGYDAAQELRDRVEENIRRRKEEKQQDGTAEPNS